MNSLSHNQEQKTSMWKLNDRNSQTKPTFYSFINIYLNLKCYSLLVDASLAFSPCCLATACCALLRLIWPCLARPLISSSTERFTFFDTNCLSFCCSVFWCFFDWIGASEISKMRDSEEVMRKPSNHLILTWTSCECLAFLLFLLIRHFWFYFELSLGHCNYNISIEYWYFH